MGLAVGSADLRSTEEVSDDQVGVDKSPRRWCGGTESLGLFAGGINCDHGPTEPSGGFVRNDTGLIFSQDRRLPRPRFRILDYLDCPCRRFLR